MSDYKDYGFYSAAPSHVHGYIGRQLMEMLDPAATGCVLDMGCGNGALVDILLDKGYDAYGIDASESGIMLANQRHPGRFATVDFSDPQLPGFLAEKKFDTVVSTEVIEHLYDPRRFMQLCRSLLIPGGQIILSTPYHGYLKNLLIAVAGKWDIHMDPLWDGGHIKLWTRRKITALLQEQGFAVTAFEGCGRLPWLWKSMLVKAVRNDA